MCTCLGSWTKYLSSFATHSNKQHAASSQERLPTQTQTPICPMPPSVHIQTHTHRHTPIRDTPCFVSHRTSLERFFYYVPNQRSRDCASRVVEAQIAMMVRPPSPWHWSRRNGDGCIMCALDGARIGRTEATRTHSTLCE